MLLSKTYLENSILESADDYLQLAENYYNISVVYKKLGLLLESKRAKKIFNSFPNKYKNSKFFRIKEGIQTVEYLNNK